MLPMRTVLYMYVFFFANSLMFPRSTALHIGSGAQHAEAVKVLLEHGAQILPDNAGTTPDQFARKDNVKDKYC
jgi:ankyrin repeat protein